MELLFAAYVPGCLAFSPCDAVDRSIGEAEKARLAPVVAKQLQRQMDVKEVTILEAFKYGAWRIYYVAPHDWEPVYLFFPNDPAKAGYLNLWGGKAQPGEESGVLSWTQRKVPNIPSALAQCFAYHVTQEGRK
jgi:hypothetical protein